MKLTTPPTATDRRTFIAKLAAGLAGALWLGQPRPASADTVPYLGEIMLVPQSFAPKGWALCNGQLLPINQNQALFSLLGTTYGGNGQTSFALPDLRDRVPIHFGQGPGLTPRSLGERSGAVTHTLLLTEYPNHTHGMRVSSALASLVSPTGAYPARNPAGYTQYAPAPPDALMSDSAVGLVGGNQPHVNMQPYLGLHFVIALQGQFPSQT
jgi:microcystin-dependent protein